MNKIFTAEEYRDFVLALRQQLEKRKLSVTDAAKVLGVSRQSLHYHLRDGGTHQPHWRLVRRAVRAWDMTIYAQRQKFDRGAFGVEVSSNDPAVQLLLTEALDRVGSANLEVSILRKDPSSLVLEVLVKFAG
jgi:DNA-binding phage protein